MISTKLPDIGTFSNKLPELKSNTVLSVNSQTKYYYPEHKTPYLFIANFLSKGNYVANRRRIEVTDRCFYFLNNNDNLEINFKENSPIQTLFILFNPQFISDCLASLSQSDEQLLNAPLQTTKADIVIPTVPFLYNASILKKVYLLSKLNYSNEDLDNLLFEFIGEYFLLLDSTQKRLKQIKAVKKTTKEEIYRRIFSAIEIMNDSVSEKRNLDTMAEAVHMNKFHFLANFKSITGTTPHQYFIQLKLQKAFELLQSKQYSVSEVCYALDFESIGSFSNLFKRKFQIAPSQIPNFR